MKEERLINVIIRPHLSEKASIGTEKRREYTFEVVKQATKSDVKNAVELFFKVLVQSVRILNVKTKPRRFGQIQGKNKAWKKAYVKLKEGQVIDFAKI
jgi:large subunit ribosomal protein L23